MSEGTDWLGKCERLLRSARLLMADGDYDSAVSRSYYAMFYAAEAVLLSRGLSFSSHAAVLSAFGKEFAKTALLPISLHRYLLDAADARISGDYDVSSGLTEEDAGRHIHHAEEFVAAASRFLTGSGTPSG